ncbi:hypothetical protein LOK49_LG08G02224 [Camellia lanceoleosa]|uniref:Uncharacterized protein n=1 Tax=Camellia lanceoleosa TaxID=1840588 RepID=A0ACC0GWB3_9ERIC|nr:hypothetical protein LOK49_LG08G02224 [Camellia lanceoleosa]
MQFLDVLKRSPPKAVCDRSFSSKKAEGIKGPIATKLSFSIARKAPGSNPSNEFTSTVEFVSASRNSICSLNKETAKTS